MLPPLLLLATKFMDRPAYLVQPRTFPQACHALSNPMHWLWGHMLGWTQNVTAEPAYEPRLGMLFHCQRIGTGLACGYEAIMWLWIQCVVPDLAHWVQPGTWLWSQCTGFNSVHGWTWCTMSDHRFNPAYRTGNRCKENGWLPSCCDSLTSIEDLFLFFRLPFKN